MEVIESDLLFFYLGYLDKCYQREEGIRNPFFLAPNYVMTELQAAVGLAQLERLESIAERRRQLGDRLSAHLKNHSRSSPAAHTGGLHPFVLHVLVPPRTGGLGTHGAPILAGIGR
jgi:hypothetical protein